MIGQHQPEEVLIFGSFSVNLTNGSLSRNGIPVIIEPKPFQVLVLLLRETGRVIRHKEFKAELWPDVTVEVGENLTTQVNKLRKALGESRQKASYILTKQREGYQFNPSVQVEHKVLNSGGEERIPGQLKSVTVALSEELGLWKSGSHGPVGNETQQALAQAIPAPSPRTRIRRLAAGGAAAVCIVASAAWWWAERAKPENPVRFKVEGSVLTAFDRKNQPVWSHPLPNIPSNDPSNFQGTFVDLDGNGLRELLYVYWPASAEEPYIPLLYCMNPDGKPRWTWKPTSTTVNTPLGRQYSGHFRFSLLGILKHARKDGGRIVVGSHHPISWPYQVALLTATGKVVSEYWHPGWLFSMNIADIDGDGVEEVLLGGTNDSYTEMLEDGKNYRATLVILDSRQMSGHGVVRSGDDRVVVGVPPAREKAVLLFRALTAPRENNLFYVTRLLGVSENKHISILLGLCDHPFDPFAYLDLDQHLRLTNILLEANLQAAIDGKLSKTASGAERIDWETNLLGRIKYLKNEFEVQEPQLPGN
jgi:DNA-binding winged helix-turn-helix (wHTH) protein